MKAINYTAFFSDGYVNIRDFLSDQRNIDIVLDTFKKKGDNFSNVVGIDCYRQADNKLNVTVYQPQGFYQFNYSLSDKSILGNELDKEHVVSKYPFDGRVNCAVEFYGKTLLTLATDDQHLPASKYILLDKDKNIYTNDIIKSSAIGFYDEVLVSAGLHNVNNIVCIGKLSLDSSQQKSPLTNRLMDYMRKNDASDNLNCFSGGPLYLVSQGQTSWLVLLENAVAGKTPKYIYLWSALPNRFLYNDNIHLSLLIAPTIPPLAVFDKPSLAIAYPYEGDNSFDAKGNFVPQICIEIRNDRYIISNIYDVNKRKVFPQYGEKTFTPSDLLRKVKAAGQEHHIIPEDLQVYYDMPDTFDIVAIGYDEYLYHNSHQWHVTDKIKQNNNRFKEENFYPVVIWHKRAVSLGFYSPETKKSVLDQITFQYETFAGPGHHYHQDEITHPFSDLVINGNSSLLISSDIWGCNVYQQHDGTLILDPAFDMVNDRVNSIKNNTIYLPKISDASQLTLDNSFPIDWIGSYKTNIFHTVSLDDNWKKGIPLKNMLTNLGMQDPDFWINIRGTITPSKKGNTFEKLCYKHLAGTSNNNAQNMGFPLIRCSVLGKGRRMIFVASYFDIFFAEVKNDFMLPSESFHYFILEETHLEELVFSLNTKQQGDKNKTPHTINDDKTKNHDSSNDNTIKNIDWKIWRGISTAIMLPDETRGNNIILDNGVEYIKFPSFLHSYPAAVNAGGENTIAELFSTTLSSFDNKNDLKFIIWENDQKAIICCGCQIGDASFNQRQFTSLENIRPVIDTNILAAVEFYGNILTWNGSSYKLYDYQFKRCKQNSILRCLDKLKSKLDECGIDQPGKIVFLGVYLYGKTPDLDKKINNIIFGEAHKYNNQLFYGLFHNEKLTVVSIPNKPDTTDYKITVLWINEGLNKFIS